MTKKKMENLEAGFINCESLVQYSSVHKEIQLHLQRRLKLSCMSTLSLRTSLTLRAYNMMASISCIVRLSLISEPPKIFIKIFFHNLLLFFVFIISFCTKIKLQ